MSKGNGTDRAKAAAAAWRGDNRSFLAFTFADLMALLKARLSDMGYQTGFDPSSEDQSKALEDAASATEAICREQGSAVREEMVVVAEAARALANLKQYLDQQPAAGEQGDWVALAVHLALFAGSRAERLGLNKAGHEFTKDLAIKSQTQTIRSAQSQAAARVNEGKKMLKAQARDTARAICGRNPCLSNEDLADQTRKAMHLSYALRTVTGWVRSWRGDGSLPPQGQRPDLP